MSILGCKELGEHYAPVLGTVSLKWDHFATHECKNGSSVYISNIFASLHTNNNNNNNIYFLILRNLTCQYMIDCA